MGVQSRRSSRWVKSLTCYCYNVNSITECRVRPNIFISQEGNDLTSWLSWRFTDTTSLYLDGKCSLKNYAIFLKPVHVAYHSSSFVTRAKKVSGRQICLQGTETWQMLYLRLTLQYSVPRTFYTGPILIHSGKSYACPLNFCTS